MSCQAGRHVGRGPDGRCYSCGRPVPADPAKYCPRCGYAYPCQCPGAPFGRDTDQCRHDDPETLWASGRCVECGTSVQAPAGAAPLDAVAAVDRLGAVWSPDLDAYASGDLDASQVRCVLCGQAPCRCPR